MKLLPCPFCGSESTETVLMGQPNLADQYFGSCDDCETYGPIADSEEEAATLWNTRTPSPTTADRQGETK